MAQNDPPNVYAVRNACACERPNIVRDVNGWVACLKCGKLPPEQVGAESNIDNIQVVQP
jgi:hypothetical protein